ncbi:EAL domain-containing protein [Aliikangiella marina]|uniref:EAL domain-containing protein n=1 Tax=Aliikangiella marina TaxID=1712262 RepID=A0A545T4G6_9GAMM|nr:GGDEF domain-containing phosphodiesterase [Aliikangiella marina]TQV72085.1 EAL domain-containing protein [Aliikangiella marina]
MPKRTLAIEKQLTWFHLATVFPLVSFGFYHYFFHFRELGIVFLISSALIGYSAFFTLTGKPLKHYKSIFLFVVSANIIFAAQYIGIRSIFYLFPAIIGIYFNFPIRFSTTVSIILSAATLFAASDLVSTSNLIRISFPIIIVIGFAHLYRRTIAEQQIALEKEASEDYLTGIYNRRSFHEWLDRTIQTHVSQHDKLALFYLDIDDFKRVNDVYGHAAGDRLLNEFTRALKVSVRSTDILATCNEHRLARLAGDEFVVAATNVRHEKDALMIAERLLEEINKPIQIDGIELHINSSIGIALCESNTGSADQLLRDADSAMFKSKSDGKNRITFFDSSIAEKVAKKNNIAEAVNDAILNQEFYLNFMPIFKDSGKTLVGAESLIRSSSEKLKGIGPDIFIPIAEEYGMIHTIDLLVITETFKKISEIQHSLPDEFVFSINFSAKELRNESFPEELKSLSDSFKITPSLIELEITETSLVSHDTFTIKLLNEIKSYGFRISLDDFGTGYTAFSQLKLYPVDTLKIDRSFVWDIDAGSDAQDDKIMVDVILSLASLFQVKVVAEGVENQTQLDYLARSQCDYYQGYLLSKPLHWEVFKSTYFRDSEKSQRTNTSSR